VDSGAESPFAVGKQLLSGVYFEQVGAFGVGELGVFLEYELLYAVVVELDDVLGVELRDVYQKLHPIFGSHEFVQVVHIFALVDPVVYTHKFEYFCGLLPSQNGLLDLQCGFLVFLAEKSGQPKVYFRRETLFEPSRVEFPRSSSENNFGLAYFGG
jgi:hypothetical protein